MYDFFWLILFLIYAAYMIDFFKQGRYPDSFAIAAFGKFFIVGTIISFLSIIVQIYKKMVIDRIVLGMNLFLLVGSLVFLGNNSTIAQYYDTYIRIVPFFCFFVVGLITTFYTPSGFIGVSSDDKKAIRRASLKLLALVIVGGLWSLLIKNYFNDWFLYVAMPLLIIRWMYERWGKQLRGEKVFQIKW